MSGLVRVGQDDFGAGMLRGVAPDVQPGVGVFNATNGLFNDDGDVYRRGGTTYFSGQVAAPNAPLTFIWSGYLNNIARLLVGTATAFYGVSGAIAPPLANLGGLGTATPVLPAIVNNTLYLPNGNKWSGGAVMGNWALPASLPVGGIRHVCAAAGRLLVSSANRVAFSVPNEPENFVADDFHDLPGGVVVMGMTAIRDTAFVFTNYGLYTISNLAFDLTDALGNIQQQLQLITPELSLWGEAGVSSWAGTIVAPCTDRIYLIDGLSAPVPLSDSIASLYMEFVRAGYYPGGAKAYRNTYFLPIIRPDTREVVAQLTCRLNRPVRARQLYYPWSAFTGHGASFVMADFALIGAAPRLLGAHRDGRIADLSGFFTPSDVRSDADGTTHPFDVETRDFPTGSGQPNHVRQVRLRYTGDGNGNVQAGISVGTQSQRYEDLLPRTYAQVLAEFVDYAEVYRGHVPASGLPPSDGDPERYWYGLGAMEIDPPGVEPITWTFGAKRTRFARMRFRTEDAISLVIHHADFSVRRASHDR
jgi:hypothetical protein